MGSVSRTGNIFEDVAIKAPVRLATTGNIALSGLLVIDGVQTVEGDRILVKDQTDATTNGIYQASTGNWARTTDARTNTDWIPGTLVLAFAGAVNAGQLFVDSCADNPAIIGTSLLTFANQSTLMTASQTATSSTSLTVGTGAVSLGTQTGKAFQANQWVLVYDATAAMLMQISSYAGGTLSGTVTATSGSGTHGDWTIVLANSAAAAGRMPPQGTGNVTGPGSSIAAHIAVFADGTGKVLADSGQAVGTLAGRNQLLYGDAGTASIPESALVPGAAPLGYNAGQPNDNLCLINDATNPTRDVNVTAGRCRDTTDVTNLHLVATMVKRLDQAWAAGGTAGAPAGACDSGTKGANQTWHIFLIAKLGLVVTAMSRTSNVATLTCAGHGSGVGGTLRAFGLGSGFDGLAAITGVTTNTVSFANAGPDVALTTVNGALHLFDILASSSYAFQTFPTGWTVKQCLGNVLTDGSANIRGFSQIGDEFLLSNPIPNGSIAATSGARTLSTLTGVPSGVKVYARVRAWAGTGTVTNVIITSPDEADSDPNVITNLLLGSVYAQAADLSVRTDTVARIGARATTGTNVNLSVTGWRDPRRRFF